MLLFLLITSTIITVAAFEAGIYPYAISAVAIILSLACILCSWKEATTRPSTISLLATALVAIIAVTAIPLPLQFSALTGTERARQNQLAAKAVADSKQLELSTQYADFFCITRNRAGTSRILLLLVAGFAMAALSSRLSSEWKDRYLKFLVLFTVAIAIAGYISQWIIPQGKFIWWFFPVEHGRPVACFINRNHFGGFVALMCAPSVFLLNESLRKRDYFSAVLWLTSLCTLTITVLASMSKGAWLACAISLLFAFLVLLIKRSFLLAAILSTIMLGIMATCFLRANDEFKARLQSFTSLTSTDSARSRVETWRDAVKIIRDYPVLGAGANAFRMVFPQYRTATTRKPFDHAENEYIQIPAELGIPAAIIIIGILTAFAGRLRNNLTGQYDVLSLCVAGALTAAAVHAAADFAIRIPLYLLTITSLMGLAVAPAHENERSQSRLIPKSVVIPGLALILAAVLATQGEAIYNHDSPDFLKDASNNDICRSLAWSPTSWQSWYYLGRTAVSSGSEKGILFGEGCITRATEYDPNTYVTWEELALLRLSLRDLDGARDAYAHLKALRPWKKINELE